MASEIPVYESVPAERVGADRIRVGDNIYSFDSADGAYILSGTAPPIVPEETFFASDIYDPMFGVGLEGVEGEGGPPRDPLIPPPFDAEYFPHTPMVVSDESYPSGYGLLDPSSGFIGPIDWSTALDLTMGGTGAVGDIGVGIGGELLSGVPGSWDSVGSIYDTPLWAEDSEFGGLGYGSLVPSGEEYTPLPGFMEGSGAGWSMLGPIADTPSFDVLGSIATGSPVVSPPTETPPPPAPPVAPVAETMPPMLPTEPVVDPYVPDAPYEFPSLPPLIDSSPPTELEPLIGEPELYHLIEEAISSSPPPVSPPEMSATFESKHLVRRKRLTTNSILDSRVANDIVSGKRSSATNRKD